jgi:methionyl-tRNA formyltransferase
MRITLFTSNKNRHNYFINLLSKISDELFVVQECGTIFPGIMPGRYPASPIMKVYFENVTKAQSKLFGNSYINNSKKNIKILPMLYGDLNKCHINLLSNFLKSDLYIVFGSSFIKGKLIDILLKNKAINIHAGLSPYYRGTDCNFWALYDKNPHLVGATIHLLSKGLDSGPILYHAMSNIKTNSFEYTMSTIKSAFHSIAERIKDNSIFNINPAIQNKNKEIRYSRKNEFNEKILEYYYEKEINLNSKKFDRSLLKDPFFFEEYI